MILDNQEALARLKLYANRRGIRVFEQVPLGHGSDGAVWKTNVWSAVKAFFHKPTFVKERECYRRLQAAGARTVNGFNVPIIEGVDNDLLVIEMTIVAPPFLLDFGKASLDAPPVYADDPKRMAEIEMQWRDLFGTNWNQVLGALFELRHRYGIYYLDPRPGNINCGVNVDDSEDWLGEPKIDYDQYEI